METLFTSQQVINLLSERYRLYNYGSKETLTMGLTDEQIQVIGDVSLALNHKPSRTASKVGRQYPKRQTVNV